MLPIIGAGLLSAGSQIINNATSAWQNASANNFNRAQADYNFSKEKQLYDEANVYNSPKMQMQRFEDAGLNKNLIYGQGTPGLAPASMPHYQDVHGSFGLPGINSNSFASTINAYQDYKIKTQQENLLKAQIDSVQQTTQNNALQNALLNLKINLNDPEAFKRANESTWHLNDTKSIAEYQLQNHELRNRAISLDNQNRLNTIGIGANTKAWGDLKLQNYQNANVNIDRDTLLSRYISDIFGDLIKKYSGKFTGAINKLF